MSLPRNLQRRSSIPSTDLATDILSVSKSIVKLYTSFSAPIFNQPWQLNTQQSSSSTGFIIQRNGVKYILTNAHALSHFTRVSVKKPAGRKYNAQVLCISDCNDLALLTVEDRTFWYNTPALPIGSLPNINTSLYVVGFPLSAEEISFSAGVVSRVAVTPFAHSGESFLSITTDAGLNPGNSGGPIVGLEDGVFKALGVAFETLPSANAVSFAISPSVIEHFLESYLTNNLGTPSLNIVTQSMESQTMRDASFIPPLSGLIEYFYNIDTTKNKMMMNDSGNNNDQQNTLTDETNPGPPCPVDSKILSPKIVVAGDPEAFELLAPHPDSTDMGNLESQPHVKIGHHPLTHAQLQGHEDIPPNIIKTLSGSSSSSMESDHNNHQHRHKHHRRKDSDSNTRFRSSMRNRRNSLCASEIYRAQHSVIGTDGDFDYVIFHPLELHDNDDNHNGIVTTDDGDNSENKVTKTTSRHTPVYRLQRPSFAERLNVPEQLRAYLTADQVNDTAIGIRVASVTPFTASAEILKPGDVLLAIDHVPIGNDQTILLRGTERVKFIHLINNKHIGDTVRVTYSRGFDIFQHDIKIEEKQYIAKWSQYQTPQWLAALGLIFVPLTSNLMASEYGSNWDSIAPVPLLQQLFTGTLERRYPDEECVVLTQILAHTCNDGYDQSMRRVTHINGKRVINLKHLATLINHNVKRYEESLLLKPNLGSFDSLSLTSNSTPQQHHNTGSELLASPNDCFKAYLQSSCSIPPSTAPSISSPPHSSTSSASTATTTTTKSKLSSSTGKKTMSTLHEHHPSSHATVCVTAEDGHTKLMSDIDTDGDLSTAASPPDLQLAEEVNPNAHDEVVTEPSSPVMGSLVDITPQQTSSSFIMDDNNNNDNNNNNNTPLFSSPPPSTSLQTPQAKPTAQEMVCSTVATLATIAAGDNNFSRQEAYSQYSDLFHNEADIKFLRITLQNSQTIILSLEDGKKNQLEILQLHQLPIPGCSDQILPMYSFGVNIVGQSADEISGSGGANTTTTLANGGISGITTPSLSGNNNHPTTPLQHHPNPSPSSLHHPGLSPYRSNTGKWMPTPSYEDRAYKPLVTKQKPVFNNNNNNNNNNNTEEKDDSNNNNDDDDDDNNNNNDALLTFLSSPSTQIKTLQNSTQSSSSSSTHDNNASIYNTGNITKNKSTNNNNDNYNRDKTLDNNNNLPSSPFHCGDAQPFQFQQGNRALNEPTAHSCPAKANNLHAHARDDNTMRSYYEQHQQSFVNQNQVNEFHVNNNNNHSSHKSKKHM